MTAYPAESFTEIASPARLDGSAIIVEPALIRHVFVWPERVFTMNQGLRGSHWAATTFTKEWREAFRLMAEGCAPLAWCHVKAQTIHGTDRRMDVLAEAIGVKAAIDGIVDAHVLPDDNPAYVRSVTCLPPVYIKGEERLIITLQGPAAKDAA